MRSFFNKIKNAMTYFLLESQKPFFIVFFILIFFSAVFSVTQVFTMYDDTGDFFKKYDSVGFMSKYDSEKIDLTFKNDGRMIIKKIGSFDLDFNKFSFVDQYYSGEYRIIFPGDFNEYFEREYFDVNNNFINNVLVSENEAGQTVLVVKEKDIFAAEISNGKNELTFYLKEPKEVYDKVVVLDPGHGGMDFGVNDGKELEKDITLRICQRIERMFDENDNVKIYLTRRFDDYVQEEERVFFANEYADLFLSIHLCSDNQYNYSDTTKIVIFEDDTTEFDISPKECADILKKSILKYTYFNSAEILNEYRAEFKNMKVPAIFCELGYSKKYADLNDFVYKAALGIYEGAKEALLN